MLLNDSVEQDCDLVGAIAATVDTLSELFTEDSASGPGSQWIGRLADEVERIAMAATDRELLGLHDACWLFQEKLIALAAQERPLTEPERSLLEEWPTLALCYVQAPGDPESSDALVSHLQNSAWTSPLPVEEAQSLRGFLLMPLIQGSIGEEDQPEVAAAQTDIIQQPFETVAEIELPSPSWPEIASEPETAGGEDLVGVDASDTPESINVVPTGLDINTPDDPGTSSAADSDTDDLLPREQAPAPIEPSGAFVPEVGRPIETAAYDTSIELAEPQSPDLVEHETPKAEPASLGEIVAPVAETAGPTADQAAQADFEWRAAAPPPAPTLLAEAPTEPELSAASQEVFELLGAEIANLQEVLAETLQAAADGAEAATLSAALDDQLAQMERLADAVQSIGLEGLSQVCRLIQSNLQVFSAATQALDEPARELLQQWPEHALAYLAAPRHSATCTSLVQYLQDARWPQALPSDEAAMLAQRLLAAKLDVEEERPAPRQRLAQAEDVSLALPQDVNAELLESLLQELPSQTADFSAILQRFLEGNGSQEDINVAKRIAHTLKGAANTVGVRGIATLTHHLEDILIALSKAGATPRRPLAEVLSSAGDCLAGMSEALLGMSEPSAEAVAVLQQVLDWANLIDSEGIPQADERPIAQATVPSPQQQAMAEPADHTPQGSSPSETPLTATSVLRVPAALVDDLLRLVGEAIILNGQLHDRLLRTLQQTRDVHDHHLLLQQLIAELEQLVDIRGLRSPIEQLSRPDVFDPLEMEQYNELHTLSRRLSETATDARELNELLTGNLAQLNALLGNQGQLHRDVEGTVMRSRMVPVQTIVPRLQRSVRQTCRLTTDKQAELLVLGSETLIDSNVLSDLVDPLMHVLRNAVDHGIEPPVERLARGKPERGIITLQFAREGSSIIVRCQDDGAGLDYAAIRRTAEERGMIKHGQTLPQDELGRLILQPGFSTRGETTQVSGRGIGMDVVYTRVLEMKGSLRLRSGSKEGLLVELRLPVTLMTTHGLLARVDNQLVAISNRGVESIVYTGDGQLAALGTQLTYRLGDELYAATTLESLLGLPPDRRRQERAARPALLVQDEAGRRHIVIVQALVDSRELVVKKMRKYLSGIRGVLGATILGDGSVAVVLDLPELLRTPASTRPGPTANEAAPKTAVKLPTALVVDDSLSARRALAQVLQDTGFDVRAARDGLEAASLLQSLRPDILVVDLEMPRMNGLELTAHVRSRAEFKHLPVLMVTSRSTEKHRSQAQAAGVDAYLVKPFSETELLQHVQRLTQLRGAA